MIPINSYAMFLLFGQIFSYFKHMFQIELYSFYSLMVSYIYKPWGLDVGGLNEGAVPLGRYILNYIG
jgi:hypothetical protein